MGKPISIRFDDKYKSLLEEAVKVSSFNNQSDYIRAAVMEKLVGNESGDDHYLVDYAEMITEVVKSGKYKSKSNFIKTAIAEKFVKATIRDEAALISKVLVNHDEQFDRSIDHVMKRVGEISMVMCEQYDRTNDSLRSLSNRMEVLESPLNDAAIYADLMDRLVTKVSSLSSQMDLMVEQNIALITLLTEGVKSDSHQSADR